MKRRTLFLIVLAGLIAFPMHAQLNAVVKEFSGKVEIKEPTKNWTPVSLNMTLVKGTTVSTGFGSRLVIDMGASRVTVGPLTRMLLEDIVKKESTNTTKLVLAVGKVNASVKSTAGERIDFTVTGPTSTAAVRGTEFSYDGYTLMVTESIVEFVNLLAQARNVSAGETSYTDGSSFPTSGELGLIGNSTVNGASTGGLLGGGEGTNPPSMTGNFTLTVQ
jgi:hypothetical protein